MISQQILTKRVIFFLHQHQDIKLNIPNLYISIDSQVTLKYLKSFPINNKENRYQILLYKVQELLKKNLINIDRIKEFSQDFFNIITEDIIILEENQKLRRKLPVIKEQILVRNQEITNIQLNIKTQCQSLNDKEDILSFILANLRNYFIKLNYLSDQYHQVNQIEVLTSINIDQLYKDNLGDVEQDYLKHYTPLLQVLNKLKSNMLKIYQEIQICDPYDIPLKCVNFLANCKNLITQLQPFLLSENCAYNRLIFHVVKCQKDNLQLISVNLQKALQFGRSLVSDLFKGYFLGFMFKDYYRDIKENLESSRQVLLKVINYDKIKDIKLMQILKSESQKLEHEKQKFIELKRIISIGQSSFMKNYLRKKQLKKASLVFQCKSQYNKLTLMIQKFIKYNQMRKIVVKLQNKQIQESSKIIKEIRLLQKLNQAKLYEMYEKNNIINNTKNKDEDKELSPQQKFDIVFLNIQNLVLQANTLKIEFEMQLETLVKSNESEEILKQYLIDSINQLNQITKNYLELETKLLNSYEVLKEEKQKIKRQSETIKQKTIQLIEQFLNNRLKLTTGFDISNEDVLCQQVKNKITQIGKAQFIVKSFIINQQKNEIINNEKELVYYRSNMEWLLIIFQGSMDENILEMVMDKLDFEVQDYLERTNKVQQLIAQLQKYQKDLKKIIKQNQLSEIHQKIFKIIKDRLQLYETIEDIYTQCLLVFKQIKKKDLQFNIENKGVILFDQPTYKHILMVYQFKNKIRTQMQQLSQLMLPSKTKNYLIDEIYQPFVIKYSQYVGFKEQQLLNFVLRVQHALNIKLGQKKILSLFEEVLRKRYEEDYWSNVQNICKQMINIKEQNRKVIDLENEQIVIHNMIQFKEFVQMNAEYYKLAEIVFKQINKIIKSQNLQYHFKIKPQFKNSKIENLKQILLQRWSQHLSHNNLEIQQIVNQQKSQLSELSSKQKSKVLRNDTIRNQNQNNKNRFLKTNSQSFQQGQSRFTKLQKY